MTIPTNKSLSLVSKEIERARRKFPNPAGLMVALMEEVGELAQAMLQHGSESERAKDEAIQVACVAIRILEEGDPMYRIPLEDTQPGIKVTLRAITEPEPIMFQVYPTGGLLAHGFDPMELDWINGLGMMLESLRESNHTPEMILMGPVYIQAFKSYLGDLPPQRSVPLPDGTTLEPNLAFRHIPIYEDMDCPSVWMGPDMRRKS